MQTKRRPRPAPTPLYPVLCAALFAPGCGGALDDAVRAYDSGLYAVALERLAGAESESRSADARAGARYALYRGLAHLAVGDGRAAAVWLESAHLAVRARPDLLAPEDTGRLESARAHLREGPVLSPALPPSGAAQVR